MSDVRRVRVVAHGLVQAVGFRAGAHGRARALAVSGWVRNNPDGTVEAELEGAEEGVASLLEWFRRGPRGARVDHVQVEWLAPRGDEGFSVR